MGSGPVSCDAKHCTAFRLRRATASIELDPAGLRPRNLARLSPMPGPDQVRQEASICLRTRTLSGTAHFVVVGMTIVRPRCEDKVTWLEKRDQQSLDVVGTDATIGESECVGEIGRHSKRRRRSR